MVLTAREVRLGWGAIWSLAWPIMISMASLNVMAVVDSIVVGQLGTTALAGVGLAIPAAHVVLAIGIGLADGVRVVTSQRTGAGDAPAVSRMVMVGLVLAALAGVPAWLALPWVEWGLGLFGGTPEVARAGAGFLFWRVLGTPAGLALFTLGAVAQGRGDTRAHMVGNLVANAVNVVLTPILALGLAGFDGWGPSGAAIANVVGQASGALVLLVRQRHATAWRWPGWGLIQASWRLGWPLGLHHLLDVGSWTVFIALLARSGEVDLAAHVLVVRVVMLSFLPGLAVAQATSVLVGQAVGASRPDRAVAAWRAGTSLAVGIMLVGGLVIAGLPGPLLAVFSPSPEVEAVARQLLWIGAAFQVFDAVATVALCALAGAGDTRATFLIGVGAAWMIKVPLAAWLVLTQDLGAAGAWLGLTGEIAVVAALGVGRIVSGGWLRRP